MPRQRKNNTIKEEVVENVGENVKEEEIKETVNIRDIAKKMKISLIEAIKLRKQGKI